jgi:hypothetical protein
MGWATVWADARVREANARVSRSHSAKGFFSNGWTTSRVGVGRPTGAEGSGRMEFFSFLNFLGVIYIRW